MAFGLKSGKNANVVQNVICPDDLFVWTLIKRAKTWHFQHFSPALLYALQNEIERY